MTTQPKAPPVLPPGAITFPGSVQGVLRRCSPVRVDNTDDPPFDAVVDRITWHDPPHNGVAVVTAPLSVVRWFLDDDEPPSFHVDWLSLDLTDATGRFHLRKWIGEQVRSIGIEWGCCSVAIGGDGVYWMLGGVAFHCLDGITFRCLDAKRVPALATIDPNDDRRLPDGSKVVDALALRLVGLHVAGISEPEVTP